MRSYPPCVDLSGIIFVVLAVGWAGYLIPKALKRHDDLAATRPVETFSESVRVVGASTIRPTARAAAPTVAPGTAPPAAPTADDPGPADPEVAEVHEVIAVDVT